MPEGIGVDLRKKTGGVTYNMSHSNPIGTPQHSACEVNKVEFQRTEKPKGIAGNKCALEQVQAADEQFGRSETKHLLPAIPFGFSSV